MPISSAKFLALDPGQFENLVFDLCKHLGIHNLTWRTPGADGGRDIEGEMTVYDLSGSLTHQKWYIECKRYEAAIDWPTVWKKIAFADAHQADFLLIATTSTLSPQCETEVARWNVAKRKPTVRSWNLHELSHVLERFPALAVLYGLTNTPSERDRGFMSLASEVSNLAQTAYCAAEFSQNNAPALEAAAALAELLSVRMADISDHNSIRVAPVEGYVDAYDWQDRPIMDANLDRFGLRAALSAFRLASRTSRVTISTRGDTSIITALDGTSNANISEPLFRLIAVWSNFELNISNAAGQSILEITPRRA